MVCEKLNSNQLQEMKMGLGMAVILDTPQNSDNDIITYITIISFKNTAVNTQSMKENSFLLQVWPR